jgi:hypothetical protein
VSVSLGMDGLKDDLIGDAKTMEVTSVVPCQGEKIAFCPISYVVISDTLVLEIFDFTIERSRHRFGHVNGV